MVPLTTVREKSIRFKRLFQTFEHLPGRGRKCMLSPRTVRNMVRESKKNLRNTVQELQTLVASWGHKVSKSTIRQALFHTNRLFGKVAQRKPLLRATNKFKCREFGKRHWNYDWNRVPWSDETKKLFGHINLWHVWRQKRDAYKQKWSRGLC